MVLKITPYPTFDDYLSAFPIRGIRQSQRQVLQDIYDAFNSGYKAIVLEAPTGFAKSPVDICIALTLGSSYIFTTTKGLQTQYDDFPSIKAVNRMSNSCKRRLCLR